MTTTKTKTRVTVWTTVWEHRHGTDVFVHRTEESAYKHAAEDCIGEWLADVSDSKAVKKIESALKEKRWRDAVWIWGAYQTTVCGHGIEDVTIEESEVLD